MADEVIEIPAPEVCPDCGTVLVGHGERERTVKDTPALEVRTVLYRIRRGYCPCCQKTVQAKEIPVLSRCLIGNQLLTHVAGQHYLHGVPLGRLESQLGIGIGTLIGGLHRLRVVLKPVMERLLEGYRQAPVKHADETGWRNNGHSGYAWLFASQDTALFRLRKTRSGQVVREVLGEEELPGILVVDRYGAYNKAPCSLQYCQAHLLRAVEDLGEEFPDQDEVQRFVARASNLLAGAIHLRTMSLGGKEYLRLAAQLRDKIQQVMGESAQHPGIQKIQDIYREHAHRMYHWAESPDIPADNNFAERELRSLVIARKVSFGSQSDEGALTRETLMSIFHTMRLRGIPVEQRLKGALDHLAAHPKDDPYPLLFDDTG